MQFTIEHGYRFDCTTQGCSVPCREDGTVREVHKEVFDLLTDPSALYDHHMQPVIRLVITGEWNPCQITEASDAPSTDTTDRTAPTV